MDRPRATTSARRPRTSRRRPGRARPRARPPRPSTGSRSCPGSPPAAGRRPRRPPARHGGTSRRHRGRPGCRSSAARGRASRARPTGRTSGRCPGRRTSLLPDRGARRRPRGSGCRRSRSGDGAHPAATSTRRSSVSRSSSAGRPWPAAPGTTRWSRNSRLPSGPRSGDGIDVDRGQAELAGRVRRPGGGPRGGRPGRARRPRSSAPRPASNCGLTSATSGPPAGPKQAADRPEDQAQRDERDVDDGEVDRLRQDAAAERPGVRPLERHDARVAPERLGQLAAPDVHGVDAARAALEEDVA